MPCLLKLQELYNCVCHWQAPFFILWESLRFYRIQRRAGAHSAMPLQRFSPTSSPAHSSGQVSGAPASGCLGVGGERQEFTWAPVLALERVSTRRALILTGLLNSAKTWECLQVFLTVSWFLYHFAFSFFKKKAKKKRLLTHIVLKKKNPKQKHNNEARTKEKLLASSNLSIPTSLSELFPLICRSYSAEAKALTGRERVRRQGRKLPFYHLLPGHRSHLPSSLVLEYKR